MQAAATGAMPFDEGTIGDVGTQPLMGIKGDGIAYTARHDTTSID